MRMLFEMDLRDVEECLAERRLDAYESDERFTLAWVDPSTAIHVNHCQSLPAEKRLMLEREARVLELLKQEGFFS